MVPMDESFFQKKNLRGAGHKLVKEETKNRDLARAYYAYLIADYFNGTDSLYDS